MLKKNYTISLALISFCSCHEAPGTVNEKFIKEKHDKYLSNKKEFLERFTETELATVDVQGFYNWLRDFKCATNDPDLKQLLADIDIAKSFCNGFSFLYNSLNIANNNTIDFSLGIIDNEKSNSIIEMVINFENLLTKHIRDLNQEIDTLETSKIELSGKNKDDKIAKLKDERSIIRTLIKRVDEILKNNKSVHIHGKKPTLHDFENYVNNLYLKQFESINNKTLDNSGKLVAQKIVSLIELHRTKDEICRNFESSSKNQEELKKNFDIILLKIAAVLLINRGAVLKEYDIAQSTIHPTFLMEVLLALLQYNEEQDRRFDNFVLKSGVDKKFFYSIIFIALSATSDSQSKYKNIEPKPFLYLHFDSVDIDKAFEIKALLDEFFDEAFDKALLKKNLNCPIFNVEFENPKTKTIVTLNDVLSNKIFDSFSDKNNPLKNHDFLDKEFSRQIYKNLKGNNKMAFNIDNPNEVNDFIFDAKSLDCSPSNFKNDLVPYSLIYNIALQISNKSCTTLLYKDNDKKDYFISLYQQNISLLKIMYAFIDESLTNGIAVDNCQSFRNFTNEVFNAYLSKGNKENKLCKILNFSFKEEGIKEPSFISTQSKIAVNNKNVEYFITLIHQNRSEKMSYGNVLLERVLNVLLLKALTK